MGSWWRWWRSESPSSRLSTRHGRPREPCPPKLCATSSWELYCGSIRRIERKQSRGLIMFTFLLWCILFVICWPLALLALVAYPFVWLILLPFRIVGAAVRGVLEVVYLAITLPFRLLAAPFRI